MKKFLFLGIGSALVFTMGGVGPAQADAGPHISSAAAAGTANFSVANQGAERCAGCHRAHTAKASFLLKEAQPNLCYSCHEAGAMGSSTDVANGKDADTGAALRGGGFDYALINSGGALKTLTTADPVTGRIGHSATIPVLSPTAPQATTSKHQINGVVSGTMWGNGAVSANIANAGQANVTLECGSCHDPHGNGNYRILKPIPDLAGAQLPYVQQAAKDAVIADPTAVPPIKAAAAVVQILTTSAGINIPDAGTKKYTTTDYWKVGDPYVPIATTVTGAPDGYIANVAQWCSTCHTRYLAPSGSYKTPLQNADKTVTDANFTYRHRSDSNSGAEKPNCIQCHVSHGSNAQMSGYAADVAFPGAATTGSADSRLLRVDNRGTCVMCHNV
jgi:predicted CXXCH cytochrome family protein